MSAPPRDVVAIVDDDARTLESLGELLEAAGFVVRAYPSATAMLHEGGLSGIDCLISDIGMPGMNGFELRRLVAVERPDLPVILLTGRPHVWNAATADIDAGRYFEKPFDGRALLAAITAAIATARETPS